MKTIEDAFIAWFVKNGDDKLPTATKDLIKKAYYDAIDDAISALPVATFNLENDRILVNNVDVPQLSQGMNYVYLINPAFHGGTVADANVNHDLNQIPKYIEPPKPPITEKFVELNIDFTKELTNEEIAAASNVALAVFNRNMLNQHDPRFTNVNRVFVCTITQANIPINDTIIGTMHAELTEGFKSINLPVRIYVSAIQSPQ